MRELEELRQQVKELSNVRDSLIKLNLQPISEAVFESTEMSDSECRAEATRILLVTNSFQLTSWDIKTLEDFRRFLVLLKQYIDPLAYYIKTGELTDVSSSSNGDG